MAETYVRKQRIEPGKTERLRELVADLVDEAAADREAAVDIWREERLHTLSLFVEHAADGDYLVWYVEAESIERLAQVRAASGDPLHDLEDEMLAEVLADPAEVGDFEPLLHAVSPDRPAEFALERQGGR